MIGGGEVPDPRKLIVFQIAGQACALPVESIQEIVPMAALAQSPGQPSLLEGFLNLRGVAVPVVRVDRLFGFRPAPLGLHTPLIILKGPRHPTAFLVEGVLDIASGPAGSWQKLDDSGSLNGCAWAQVEWAGRAVSVLAPERLLLAQERECLEELQEQAQRRIEEVEGRPA
jgi:purine-binding chemotaxis protein CheW